MARKDNLVGSGVIRRSPTADIEQMEAMKKEQKQIFREIKKTTDDELAGDTFFQKNYHLSKMKEKFPHHPEMWHVDKFYPRAAGGPLYLDRVVGIDKDNKNNEIKKQALKELGLRYVQWVDGMTVNDAKELLA